MLGGESCDVVHGLLINPSIFTFSLTVTLFSTWGLWVLTPPVKFLPWKLWYSLGANIQCRGWERGVCGYSMFHDERFWILSLSKGSMKWISSFLIFILLFKLYLFPLSTLSVFHYLLSPHLLKISLNNAFYFLCMCSLYCFSETGGREEIKMLWSNYHKFVGGISK